MPGLLPPFPSPCLAPAPARSPAIVPAKDRCVAFGAALSTRCLSGWWTLSPSLSPKPRSKGGGREPWLDGKAWTRSERYSSQPYLPPPAACSFRRRHTPPLPPILPTLLRCNVSLHK